MSRIGKLPIILPEGVQAEITKKKVAVTGPKGQLEQELAIKDVLVELVDGSILVTVKNPEDRQQRAYWGLYRSLINNLVIGVSEGFEKKLEVNGVGYKVAVSGNTMTLNLGYSHPIVFVLPEGITATVEGNIITVSGIDKQSVGNTAAKIRKFRKPEPYKGKGVKYVEEVIIRKEGKAASKGE